MAVYAVVRPNDFFKRGTYVEDIEGGQVINVTMEKDGNSLKPYRQYGLAIPMNLVRKYLLRIQGRGIDMEGLKG